MSQFLATLLTDLLTVGEPMLKAYIIKLLQSLDASVTNASEKALIEAIIKVVGG